MEQVHMLTSTTNKQIKGIIFHLETQMSLNKTTFRETMRDVYGLQAIRHTDPSESKYKPQQTPVDDVTTPQPTSSNEGSELASASSSSIASSFDHGLSNQDDLAGHFQTPNNFDLQHNDYRPFPQLMSGRSDSDSDGTHAGVPISAMGLEMHEKLCRHVDDDDDDRASVMTLKPIVEKRGQREESKGLKEFKEVHKKITLRYS